jgi:mycothiol synthase
MTGPALPRHLPQLRMEIRGLVARHAGRDGGSTPPPGYGLRTFRPGDEDAWLALLQSGEFSPWDRARLDQMLASEHVRVPHDGILFATQDDRPVGAASTHLHPGDHGIEPELGWVVVDPRHRGLGLGRLVCDAVLEYVARLGYDHAYLKTDDFRLPAIRTYLRLGFEPVLIDPSHPARWAAIYRLLGDLPTPPLPRTGEGAGG